MLRRTAKTERWKFTIRITIQRRYTPMFTGVAKEFSFQLAPVPRAGLRVVKRPGVATICSGRANTPSAEIDDRSSAKRRPSGFFGHLSRIPEKSFQSDLKLFRGFLKYLEANRLYASDLLSLQRDGHAFEYPVR
jgi:hypothetical protein